MKFIFKQSGYFIPVFTLCLLLSIFSFAQEVTSSLNGTVKDSSGAVVSGANISISDPQKNNTVIRTTTTNENGEFSAPNLAVGNYQVTVEAPNFKKSVQKDVKLNVGQPRTLDVTLEAGKIQEVVTVEADPVAVNLTTPTAGTLINGDQVREIPVNNRNWIQLATLAPGVSNDLADQVFVGTTNPDGQANTVNISVNGGRSAQNTYTVDGADITDRGSNITIQAYPSVDSISEFQIIRSQYSAETGRSGGGQINVVTRSGTDHFHGNGYEFIRNEAFNANNFLINSSTAPPFGYDSNGKAKRAPFRYNDYGFTIGGPVYFFNFGEHDPKDPFFTKYKKTYFFFSEEARRDRRFTSAATVTVPDANLRNGIFPVDVCIAYNAAGTTCTTTLPAGTAIPANLISPAARGYLNGVYNKLPLPNAGTATAPYNLVVSLPNKADFNQQIFKLDHTFSDKWSMYYRFENDKIPTIDANALFSSGSGLPGVSTTSTNSPGRTHTVQSTYAVSPKLIIEGRYTYAYGAILSHNIGLLALTNTTVPVNLPFANQKDRIPTVTNNGFSNLTSFGPYNNFSNKNNWSGSVTWIFGSHTTKYGASYSMYRKNENALTSSPFLNEGIFSAFNTVLPTTTTSSTLNQNRQRFANFLLGNVATFTQASLDYTADLRQKTFEAYGQDEWHFRRNLTLTYGVRYSYFQSPYDKNGHLSNFDSDLYSLASAPQVTGAGNRVAGTGNFFDGLIVNSQNVIPTANGSPTVSPFGKYVVKAPKTDFAPRVGIAWDPFGKGTTSVRLGYGISYDQVLNGTLEQNIGQNQPYQITATASNTTLDNPASGVNIAATPLSVRAVQVNWHDPYMQNWSLDVQHQLGKATLVDIGYYGSKGTHLIGTTELNDLRPGQALASQCVPLTGATSTSTLQTAGVVTVPCQTPGQIFTTSGQEAILDQIRPYRGYRSIAIIEPRYNSNYHSLQVSAQHRFSGVSQVNLNYTFSKNLTNSPNDRSNAPQNTYDIRSEYQRATLDRRHILSINYVYVIPFFNEQKDLVGKLLGGFEFSGIATYNSGLPFTATTSGFDPAGLGTIPALVAGTRPNLLCDPNVNAPHTLQQYFNTSCFQLNSATGVPNTPGSAGRGVINGPSTTRVDFTTIKNIRFGENIRIQLRAEIYNIFNHTNFRTISASVTSAAYGTVTAVRDPRTMQFGAKVYF